MSRLAGILAVKDAPYLLAVFFGAAAWCFSHVIDRFLAGPLIAFKTESVASYENTSDCILNADLHEGDQIHVVHIENLSPDVALHNVRIFIALSSGDSRKAALIRKDLCWRDTSLTVADGVDTYASEKEEAQRELLIDELLPGSSGSIFLISNNESASVIVKAKSGASPSEDRSNFQFSEMGLKTWLIKYEVPIIAASFAIFLGLGVLILSSYAAPSTAQKTRWWSNRQ